MSAAHIKKKLVGSFASGGAGVTALTSRPA
jgi:hypothetical protein